jgi:response regulator RpfG family c-di-GMP phosphodiesterase
VVQDSGHELDAVVDILAAVVQFRDDESELHVRRVTDLALSLAAIAAPSLAADPHLRHGFLLHDIGLIGVPEHIVRKRHGLTTTERRLLERHPVLGAELVTANGFFGEVVRDVVAFHHERWDGNGYPWGLRGDRIPLAARIFALADGFDTLTSGGWHGRALSVDKALEHVQARSGAHFDPELVERFGPLAATRPARPGRGPRHLRAA